MTQMRLIDLYDTAVILCAIGLVATLVGYAYERFGGWRERRDWHHRQAHDLWGTLHWLNEVAPRPATVQRPADPSPTPRRAAS